MQILDHGVSPAGASIATAAFWAAGLLVLVSTVAYWLWRRRDRRA